MKLVLFACLFLLATCNILALDDSFASFMDFVHQYDRRYQSVEEMQYRFAIFQDNVKRVQEYRDNHLRETGESGDLIYGITKFADLSKDEFKSRYLNFRPSPTVFKAHRTIPALHTPDVVGSGNVTSFDWRNKKAVTAVKDQGQCGSCWAFSTAEEVESVWFLKKQQLLELSPQQIVSCDTVDLGCSGGDTVQAYVYVKANGLETEDDYPYTSGDSGDDGTCSYDSNNVAAQITGFNYATPPCTDSCTKQNETTLANSLVNVAPVSICVYAESWQLYTSGILKSNCPKDYSSLDHCVQLVGFNTEGATPYWIIRNSWNTDWGVDGYIWVQMGKNLCGVADEATIVTV